MGTLLGIRMAVWRRARGLRHEPTGALAPRNAILICVVAWWYQRINLIPALMAYVDAFRCVGFLCDLVVVLFAIPWSLAPPLREAGDAVLIVLIAFNAWVLYAFAKWASRLYYLRPSGSRRSREPSYS
jgi:hypothetical protein